MFIGRKAPHLAILAILGLFITVSILSSRFALASHDEVCSSQWRVTGYFTPLEIDYSRTELSQIYIEKLGKSVHSKAFLKEVKIEGWGKTKDGWYLGRFSNKWHKSKYPLNSIGKPLKTGSIATDTTVIPTGSTLIIPSLPNKLKHQIYVSDDVGSAIRNTHVDIYMGEGKQTEKTTYEVTGKDHVVCHVDPI